MKRRLLLPLLLIAFATFTPTTHAAVTRDSYSNSTLTGWSSGTSLSWTHTTGAGLSNSVGIVMTAYSGVVSGTPTWGGNNMTLVNLYTDADGANFYTYCIVNPPSGAQTISLSYSPSASYLAGVSEVVYNANPSCTVDSYASNHTISGTSFSVTTTTVADNSMLIGMFYNNTGAARGAGSNTTLLTGTGGATITLAQSTSSITPAGSSSLNMTSSSGHWTGVMVSIAPYTAPAFIPSVLGLVRAFWLN